MPVIFSKEKLGKARLDGFYETPIKTVKYMSDKILDVYQNNMSICDPCVGDGIFLEYLAKHGVKKKIYMVMILIILKLLKLKKNFLMLKFLIVLRNSHKNLI